MNTIQALRQKYYLRAARCVDRGEELVGNYYRSQAQLLYEIFECE